MSADVETDTSEQTETTADETVADETTDAPAGPGSRIKQLEREGDIAADYLEELLDIADLDGDLDMDVEGDRASVSIVGGDVSEVVATRPGATAFRVESRDGKAFDTPFEARLLH